MKEEKHGIDAQEEMDNIMKKELSKGVKGAQGANDTGYMIIYIRDKLLPAVKIAITAYNGAFGALIPNNHHLVNVLNELKELDKEQSYMANLEHDPSLFKYEQPKQSLEMYWASFKTRMNNRKLTIDEIMVEESKMRKYYSSMDEFYEDYKKYIK